MEGITSTTFGYLIAFLIPGSIALKGLSYISNELDNLIIASSNKDASIGVLLYLAIAALASGLVISAIRDVIMDRLLCKVR